MESIILEIVVKSSLRDYFVISARELLFVWLTDVMYYCYDVWTTVKSKAIIAYNLGCLDILFRS